MSKRSRRRKQEQVHAMLEKPLAPSIAYVRVAGGFLQGGKVRVWNTAAPSLAVTMSKAKFAKLQAAVEVVQSIVPELAMESGEGEGKAAHGKR